jgi:nucleotide-binding universal stress UspA family protein
MDKAVVKVVRAAAKEASAKGQDVPKVDVIVRQRGAAPHEAIAREAQRGYDLLVVGIERTAASRTGFHDDLSKLVSQFDGSIAIVAARGEHEKDPAAPLSKILAPVTGNENSRRGAEVAITLAKSAHAEVVALSVISPDSRNKPRLRRETKVVTDEIERISRHLKAKVKIAVRSEAAAEDAILQTIERGKHDLVVMGVSRRPGEALAFGDVADALLKKAKCSLLFVAPQARGAMKSTPKGGEAPAAG